MKKSSKAFVFSAAGVVAFFLILVAVNVISNFVKVRADLTAERAFTLTPGTRAILKKIDAPLQVRLYVTRGPEMPVPLRNYASQVEDLLNEFHQANPHVTIQKLNPEPDSDAEDSARMDGVMGQQLPTGGSLYLGVSISQLDRKEAIPFLTPDRERLMEYDLVRAISQVLTDKKPVIGLLTPLEVTGGGMMNPMGEMSRPWTIISELRRQFEVREISFTADAIPADVKVLLVIAPENIGEPTQYAIDQFLLRGGKMLALLDPWGVVARNMQSMGVAGTSTLDKLLPAWGIQFTAPQVVADMDYTATLQQGRQPVVLQLTEQALDPGDVITGDIDNMVLGFAGAFEGNAAEGLQRTVLLKSSRHSQLVSPSEAQTGSQSIIRDFKNSGTEYPLAIRLTGKFKTAFPDGKPGAAANEEKEKPSADVPLKEAAAEGTVILVGDADFIHDNVGLRRMANPFGEPVLVPVNGNLPFALNAIEQLGGDENLIKVRGRASRERAFTVVKEMQANAQQQFQKTIQDLEQELQQTEAKLSELQQGKPGEQQFILSPEQQQQLENFQKKQGEVRQKLKQVRRDLARGIDSLEVKLKWLNIGLMPLLVALAGLVFFLIKRQRAAHR